MHTNLFLGELFLKLHVAAVSISQTRERQRILVLQPEVVHTFTDGAGPGGELQSPGSAGGVLFLPNISADGAGDSSAGVRLERVPRN